MVLINSNPFSNSEITQISQEFEVYIKTVIDIEKRICCAGVNLHADGEKLLLDQGSKQADIWGGGIDLTTKIIDFNSFINIRPNQNNPSSEIIIPQIRKKYEQLSKYFFKSLYE